MTMRLCRTFSFATGQTVDEMVDIPNESPADVQAARRASANVSRAEFCNALLAAGALTFTDALAAAKGDWPAPFAGALAAIPQANQAQAQILWAAAQTIDRMNPFILAVQAALGWTDAQADALFGIA